MGPRVGVCCEPSRPRLESSTPVDDVVSLRPDYETVPPGCHRHVSGFSSAAHPLAPLWLATPSCLALRSAYQQGHGLLRAKREGATQSRNDLCPALPGAASAYGHPLIPKPSRTIYMR